MNESRPSSLEELAVRCRACTACGLASTRTHVVFGVGVPDAEVLLVGEGPGENEDLQGEPLSLIHIEMCIRDRCETGD